MPWAMKEYKRTFEVYREFFEELYQDKRRSIDLIAREQLIRGNILKYDFTKRQMTILMFIMTFSYNMSKEWAYIPKLLDFQQAGIGYKKVRNELNQMIKMGVIEHNEKESLFRITEPKLWNCPINKDYDDDRSRQLFLMNLQHSGVDVSPIIQKLKEIDGQ